MIFWLSLPHTQTQPQTQTGMKVNIVFGVVWGNLRKIMATFASEALRNRTRDRTRPTPIFCKKHTTFFIANWVIKFIYTRRKATKKKTTEKQPKTNSAELPRFFSYLGQIGILLRTPRDIGCEHAEKQYHFLWLFIIMLNKKVSPGLAHWFLRHKVLYFNRPWHKL